MNVVCVFKFLHLSKDLTNQMLLVYMRYKILREETHRILQWYYSRICLICHLKGIIKNWRIRRTDELRKQVKTLS